MLILSSKQKHKQSKGIYSGTLMRIYRIQKHACLNILMENCWNMYYYSPSQNFFYVYHNIMLHIWGFLR
jgi:hypothetical protein